MNGHTSSARCGKSRGIHTYHPTLIGDNFCSGRYAIVHKLGFGGYSTSWLARDHQPHSSPIFPTRRPLQRTHHHAAAADIWTLGERLLFETFVWDPDDIIAEMVNTVGLPPSRWWDSWRTAPSSSIQMGRG
ncbi:hypothetical protein BJX76DRAFT_338121 [Aspergillus varians]